MTGSRAALASWIVTGALGAACIAGAAAAVAPPPDHQESLGPGIEITTVPEVGPRPTHTPIPTASSKPAPVPAPAPPPAPVDDGSAESASSAD